MHIALSSESLKEAHQSQAWNTRLDDHLPEGLQLQESEFFEWELVSSFAPGRKAGGKRVQGTTSTGKTGQSSFHLEMQVLFFVSCIER